MQSFYLDILDATKVTIGISLASMIIGVTLAIFITAMEDSKVPFKQISQGFSSITRALPDILIIFGADYIIQYFASKYFSIYNISPFISGTIALSLIVSAFASQIFLSALKALPHKEILMAKKLGLSRLHIFIHIMAPQMTKYSLPMIINLFLVIVKDSSIVSLIGLNDIMNEAHIAASESFNAFDYYGFAALIYLCLSFIILVIQNNIKKYLGEEHVKPAY